MQLPAPPPIFVTRELQTAEYLGVPQRQIPKSDSPRPKGRGESLRLFERLTSDQSSACDLVGTLALMEEDKGASIKVETGAATLAASSKPSSPRRCMRSKKSISRYETGDSVPSVETLLKLAKVLKKPATYFLDELA